MSQFLVVPKDFPKIFAVVLGMNLQIFYMSGQISSLRKEIFTQQFMGANFGDMHRKELGQDIQHMGYPDAGDNIYAAKLPYGDWYRFAVLQDIHQDYLNNLSLATLSVVAAGLVKPNYGVGVGAAFIVSKALYAYFNKKNGKESKGRKVAKMLCLGSVLAGLGIFAREYFFK